MSSYEIVCTDQTGCTQGGHIVSVGTGADKNAATQKWSVRDVWTALDSGNVFYSSGGGKVALVNKYNCPCGLGSLRSAPDATTANNLDSLRLCRWN